MKLEREAVLLEGVKHAEDGLLQSNLQHAHTLPGVQLPLPPAHPDRRKCTTIFIDKFINIAPTIVREN